MLWIDVLGFVVACLILVKSGDWLVKSLLKISSFLRMKEFVTGFILMALFTTVPELFIGITSALNKMPELALGTAIGSNIADLTLVIGVAVLLGRGLPVNLKTVKRDSFFMLIIASVPVIFMIDKSVSRIEAAVLVAIFFAYMWYVFSERWLFRRTMDGRVRRPLLSEIKSNLRPLISNISLFLFSLILLFISANFVVTYAINLSVALALPTLLIGLFMVAVGTSLPDLVFGAKAVLTKHGEMALGDVIGAVVVNSTLVIGISALIFPLTTANIMLFFTGAIFMLLVAFLFTTFVETENKITVNEGISLILLYAFFIFIEFYIKTLTA